MADEQQINRKMDRFGNEDFTIPEVKLVQNVGGDQAKQMSAKPGDLFISMMGEVIGETGLDIILVDMQKTRTYWGRADINDEPPQCGSDDAETNLSQNGDQCLKCPFYNETPWLLDATKRREMCLINYNLLVFRTSDMLPLLIRTSGISTAAARNLLTSFRLNRKLAGEYHRVIVHVGAQKKKTASGEAFAFVFTPKGRVSDEKTLAEYKAQTIALLGITILPPNNDEIEPPVAPTMLEPAPATATGAPAPAAPVTSATPPKVALKIDTDF